MIILENKYDCCGCHACMTICPRKCIAMHADQEGFLYPSTDQSLCVDCHLCENVCPMILQKKGKNRLVDVNRAPIKAYAARSGDARTSHHSASGGIFPVLAEQVLNEGGVVFGARWDEDFMGVHHDFITDRKDLHFFQGSKYVQSTIGNAFFQVRDFLKQNRKVLFSGTPCQIQGLKKVIRKHSELLITVDVACHSVPSPKVWQSFFRNLITKNRISEVSGVFMRKKIFSPHGGWRCDSFLVESANSPSPAFEGSIYETSYGRGFLEGMFSRPSCEKCPAKNLESGSDITLGDFWGVENYFPDLVMQEGLSIIICKTQKAHELLESVRESLSVLRPAEYEWAAVNNEGLRFDPRKNPHRDSFFRKLVEYRSDQAVVKMMESYFQPKLFVKIKMKLKSVVKRMILPAAALFRRKSGVSCQRNSNDE